MKKRITLLSLLLAGMLCLAACGNNSDDSQSSDSGSQEEQDVSDEEKEDEKDEERTETALSGPDAGEDDMEDQSEAGPASITIYYGNEDATAFTSKEVLIDSLSPEDVLDALTDNGVITEDVEILSFKTTAVGEKSSIEIDFNSAFSSYISNMGSTGEYYIIGSVCNTFLDAYDCEQVKITVEGKELSTGHAEYPGYMTTFE